MYILDVGNVTPWKENSKVLVVDLKKKRGLNPEKTKVFFSIEMMLTFSYLFPELWFIEHINLLKWFMFTDQGFLF